MRTIATANQEGQYGKAATGVSLAAAFAAKGDRTLLTDLDARRRGTIGFGRDPDELSMTIYDIPVRR